MRRFWAFLVLVTALFGPATAQQDDKGYLTGLLESNLSGAGRKVTIDGFAGALSSRATFDRLTIADADGVWITVEGGAISWNRAALLKGNVEIAEMSAARIDLVRPPRAEGPQVEARSFSLPDLPVSVAVGLLQVRAVHLGPDVLGQDVTGTFEGSANLSGGEGTARLSLRRTDGKVGDLALTGAYSNATGAGTVDLLAREGPDGIAATLMGLPGRPAAELALHGTGGSADFRTDLVLSTDGMRRLTGTAQTRVAAGQERTFSLVVKGDISPLMAEEYRAFFGTNASLLAEGRQPAGGGVDLTRLVVETAGLDLTGRLSLSPENLPLAAALTLRLGLPDGSPVLLPVAGARARTGEMRLRFDAASGDQWTLDGDFTGFERSGFIAEQLVLSGAGSVVQASTSTNGRAQIAGGLRFVANGLRPDDPALAEALGSEVTGQTDFTWQEGEPLHLEALRLQAGNLRLGGDLTMQPEGLDLTIDGALTLEAADIARFSGLAGRPLAGAAEIGVTGRVLALSRAFDIEAMIAGRDLAVGQDNLDRLLRGASQITLSAVRDGTGLTLRSADLVAGPIHATGSGRITSATTDLAGRMDLSDLSGVDPRFAGQIGADVMLKGPTGGRIATVSGSANGLRLGQPTLDPLLGGETVFDLTAEERGAAFRLTEATVSNPALTLDVVPEAEGYGASLILDDLGRIVPDYPGRLTAKGTVQPEGDGYRVTAGADGPGGTRLDLGGTVAGDFASVDLTARGQTRLDVLNRRIAPRSVQGALRFDMAMQGRPGLEALSGQFSTSGARLVLPAENVALEAVALSGVISGGAVRLDGSGQLRGGGSVALSGRIGTAPPFDAAMTVSLKDAALRRPGLLTTRVDGQVTLTGPLMGGAVVGGAVTLRETEITVAAPETDVGAVPVVAHVNEGAASRQTRIRAGAIVAPGSSGSGAGGPVYGLDLAVSAPARIFVRGRGLDAELGGAVRLRGTTANVEAIGEFDLIRGRLSILGKRFVLDQGLVQLQGSLVPYIEFSALADTESGTTTILISGPATQPEIHFSSTSGLPEEEVLSELIFGNRLDNLSAFQLAQLANAIATLSGRGGDGLVGKLRRNARLDDLDIVADDQGNAAIKAGKYLSDKIYSEATIGQDGTSKIELNLELGPDLNLKGALGSDGQSGLGVFYTRDY